MTETLQTSASVPYDTFGARLAVVRQACGWNIQRAANECGISHTSWANYEANKQPRDLAAVCRRVAAASGFSYTWLMIGGPLRPPPESANIPRWAHIQDPLPFDHAA